MKQIELLIFFNRDKNAWDHMVYIDSGKMQTIILTFYMKNWPHYS